MQNIYLTPHFTLSEMTVTKTGIVNTPNAEQTNQLRLLCRDILEPLRFHGECAPIIVDSAFRSPLVNKAVGGVPTSQHLLGQAADIHCYYSTPRLYEIIFGLVNDGVFNVGQCIIYTKSHFVHISLPTSTHKNEFIIRNK